MFQCILELNSMGTALAAELSKTITARTKSKDVYIDPNPENDFNCQFSFFNCATNSRFLKVDSFYLVNFPVQNLISFAEIETKLVGSLMRCQIIDSNGIYLKHIF